MIDWPSRSSGSSSSSALRICEMSISMCTYAGVPSVRTMWSASAAASRRSDNRSRPDAITRSSRSCVPVSWNGMRQSPIDSSTRGSLSMPMTSRPRSANDSASGSPTRPRPTTATVVDMAGTLGGPAEQLRAGKLAREGEQERRVVVEVARQQAARLLGDPVGPLEPALLHPRGRLRDAAGMEVERGADGAEDRRVDTVAHARHPLLLARHAGADPDDVGVVGVDARGHLVLLALGELAERG